VTTLVTGASGFIGSHLVDLLRARGTQVRAMVRRSSSRENLRDSDARLCFAGLDDVDSLVAALEGVELVYHVAGVTAAFDRAEFRRANTLGVANLLEAIQRAQGGPRRLVLVSSLMAAGPSHPDVARREHHRVEEFTEYGKSKLAAEQLAFRVAAERGLSVVIVRPPLVYGPRDQDVLQIIRAADRHLVGQAGLRPKWLSAVHVADLVEGIVLAGERGTALPGEPGDHVLGGGGERHDHVPEDPSHPAGRGIYYFTDGSRHTEASLGQAAARALGKRAITVPLPGPAVLVAGAITQAIGRLRGKAPALNRDKARATLATGWWCNDDRARAELGYAPRYSLDAGLAHTVAWLRERAVL
jgi:nucleoside-diphosphate-sugar epimerase